MDSNTVESSSQTGKFIRKRKRQTSNESTVEAEKRQTSDERTVEEDSTVEERTEFVSLADDCIFDVFRCLPLEDLCSISKTCQRLHLLAANQFQRSYPSIAKGRLCVWKNENDDQIRLSPQEVYVECFSKFFQDVQISLTTEYDDDTIKSIRSKCNVNLRRIKFFKMILHESIGNILTDTFKHIKAVQFHDCDGNDECYTSILKHCTNLKHLSVIVRRGGHGVNLLMHGIYPKLTSFQYGYTTIFEKDNFAMFVRQNPTIRTIMLEIDANALEIIKHIIDYATNLEALYLALPIGTNDFKVIFEHLKIVCDREQFKRMELSFANSTMESLLRYCTDDLASLTKLQGLHLNLIDIVTVFPVINSLANLKILSFNYASINFHMSDGDAPNLEELRLNELYNGEFRCVDTFVRHAAKLKKVFIPQCNYLNNLNIDRYQFNAMHLNAERNKLPGAVELMIYTDYPDNPNNFDYNLVKITQAKFTYIIPSDINHPFIVYTCNE